MSQARCRRCHRILKDAASIEVGLGPTCFTKVTGKPFPRPKQQRATAATKGRSSNPKRQRSTAGDGTISLDAWMKEVQQGPDDEDQEEQDGEKPPQYEERAHGKAVSPLESNRIVSLPDPKSNTEV